MVKFLRPIKLFRTFKFFSYVLLVHLNIKFKFFYNNFYKFKPYFNIFKFSPFISISNVFFDSQWSFNLKSFILFHFNLLYHILFNVRASPFLNQLIFMLTDDKIKVESSVYENKSVLLSSYGETAKKNGSTKRCMYIYLFILSHKTMFSQSFLTIYNQS